MVPRLLKKYREEFPAVMKEKFVINNVMALPRLEKIIINMGVGRAIDDMKVLESAMQDLAMITGQKPSTTRAKLAISNFKLKQGVPIGCKVTLRETRMYEFLDRLFNIALARIRDFNGMSRNSFDKQGNYSIGISDQSIFPEIDTGKIQFTQGMDIIFVFNGGPKEHTMELLRFLGMPFAKK